MKKIVILVILLANIGMAITNQEIITNGTKIQKQFFDKHFNNSKIKNDKNLLNKVYPEIVSNMYGINQKLYNSEFSKSKGKRKSNLQKMYTNYVGFITESSNFSKSIFGNLIQEKDEYQSYAFTNTYILLENFNLNLNTLSEGEKNPQTIDKNVQTIVDYMYFVGDKISKEEYMKMSNSELEAQVNKEFLALTKIIDTKIATGDANVKKNGKNIKTNLLKLEKSYNKYDESYEELVNTSNLSLEHKEKLKKLLKYEKLANLKFFIKSLETKKENNDN